MAAERDIRQAQTEAINAEREELAERIADFLDGPLTFLGFVMFSLLVSEFAGWVPPRLATLVSQVETAIWLVFAFEFLVRLILACDKVGYVKRHWLAALAVILPAFRVVR